MVDLKDDLNKDVKGLESQKIAINQLIDRFRFARNLNKKRIDSLDSITPKYQFSNKFRLFFGEENNGNYEGFESSGKTVFIENKKLKKLILSYYKHHIPATAKTGETFITTFTKINNFVTKNIVIENSKNIVFLDSDFQTDLEIGISYAKENIRIGDVGMAKIKDIIAEIDRELEK